MAKIIAIYDIFGWDLGSWRSWVVDSNSGAMEEDISMDFASFWQLFFGCWKFGHQGAGKAKQQIDIFIFNGKKQECFQTSDNSKNVFKLYVNFMSLQTLETDLNKSNVHRN